jgi:hypothetical protein
MDKGAPMILTRREKHVLTVAAIVAFIFIFIPQQILNDWEYVYLLCFVAPIGFYIATDPERIKGKGK